MNDLILVKAIYIHVLEFASTCCKKEPELSGFFQITWKKAQNKKPSEGWVENSEEKPG
jgi:hypothetical protein